LTNSNWNITNIPDQKGKVFIITGASSGLGKEATKQLADKNATIIMGVRVVNKTELVKQEILVQYPKSDIKIKHLDLGDLVSIEKFSDEIINEYDHLDVLINNAGVMMCPYSTTKDGFEIQMGTNHLGVFALTGRLMPLLKKTKNSRIIVTSSAAHKQGKIDFSDLNWTKRKYSTIKAYGDSKLASLYFTYEFARKFGANKDAPKITAAHPGWTKTDLQRHSALMRFFNNFFSQKVEMGVLPTLRAAIDVTANTGDYFGPDNFLETKGHPVKVKSNELSHDIDAARKLWELSEKLTGVSF